MHTRTHARTLPFVLLRVRPHMLMCGLRVRVPADLLSLKDGMINGGGQPKGSLELVSDCPAKTERGLRSFYQAHMHVGRTLFMFPRMASCLRSGKEPEERKKKVNRKEEHVKSESDAENQRMEEKKYKTEEIYSSKAGKFRSREFRVV